MRKQDGKIRIGVVSGKGGVGKSTVTAAIAHMMARDGLDLVAVDCDVDAPNLSLLFNMEGETMNKKPVQTTEKASFNEEKCIGCMECVEGQFCIFNAIRWNVDDSIPILDTLACEGCGSCAVLCKQGAFDIGPIDSGTIYHDTTEMGFPLVFGETIIGASTSGKTVAETKTFAEENAPQADFMIIDGPPGIGCPVLATLTGLQFAIVVMEPFPAAFHDASRVINVIEGYNLPFGIVINRCDAWEKGFKDIQTFIKERGYTLLGNIPIDMNVPRSVASMQTIMKYSPGSPAAVALEKIFGNLKVQVGLS
ncbi:P-loop NTPase [Candidatus Bathyarchaeota archaeon]|nr:P-loop NTPase [Candidatus Bathyarchaeota archaeon]